MGCVSGVAGCGPGISACSADLLHNSRQSLASTSCFTAAGAEVGLWMCLAFGFEVAGVQLTSATKAAFLNQVRPWGAGLGHARVAVIF